VLLLHLLNVRVLPDFLEFRPQETGARLSLLPHSLETCVGAQQDRFGVVQDHFRTGADLRNQRVLERPHGRTQVLEGDEAPLKRVELVGKV
jgi:hypothetical protein